MPYVNVYYDPEKLGLEIVDELDYGASYEFDKLVVWRRKSDGELRWGTDSGCSCPTPFEDIDGFEDLQKLPETFADFELAVKGLGYGDVAHCTETSKLEFIQKIKELLK